MSHSAQFLVFCLFCVPISKKLNYEGIKMLELFNGLFRIVNEHSRHFLLNRKKSEKLIMVGGM